MDCPHFQSPDGFFVVWNERQKRLETTEWSIRKIPPHFPGHIKNVAMCDPRKGTCRRDECTYAHGQAEQREWNQVLRSHVQHSGKGFIINHDFFSWLCFSFEITRSLVLY